ncbi:hypothetical protein LX69_03052 [Breznakibacter xylanolyticus]|uniref:Uncharacterized protein n=1 Tax=Breznakibacter xylanolyticus TaxID=990 RepID=A0A2W7MUL7_9BACT|nr:hypothetical protein LX69_03052 [Breznakibacter xylanolyticus]
MRKDICLFSEQHARNDLASEFNKTEQNTSEYPYLYSYPKQTKRNILHLNTLTNR